MVIDKVMNHSDQQYAFAKVNLIPKRFPTLSRHSERFDMYTQTRTQATILVVDDEDEVRQMVTDILEDEGYPVVTARNGQEALNYLQTAAELPSLILLDLMMPVMDGPAFRKEQQRDARLKNIPVVVFSAGRNRQQASALDAAAFIDKPFDYDLLCNTIAVHAGVR